MRKINRMDEFDIDELSSVDEPAQAPALALLLKAKGDTDLAKRLRLTSIVEGHQHVLDTTPNTQGSDVWENRTSYDHSAGSEFTHSHPIVLNDDGTLTIGVSDGHTHTVIEKRLTAEDLEKTLGEHNEPASSGGGQSTGEPLMTKTAEEIAAADEAVEKRIAASEARAEKAEQLASMTDVQKAHYGALTGEAQESFLAASPEVRQGAVEKAAGDDPVVYECDDGTEIRKSNGDLVAKMARDRDSDRRELVIEKAARQREVFAKRAKEELGNLPGKESAQVALLKAVAGIPDKEDQEGALEILKAANTGVSKAFETAGSVTGNEGGAGEAEAKLEKMAQTHFEASGDGGSFQKSYKAVLETPEGRKLYRETHS